MQDNPTLNREHIDRIRSVAQLRSVRRGEVLYEPSCPDVPLFIVLDGTVSISRAGEDEKVLAIRESGKFTGEMSLISGNRPLVIARVTQDGAVLELTREKVLSLWPRIQRLATSLWGPLSHAVCWRFSLERATSSCSASRVLLRSENFSPEMGIHNLLRYREAQSAAFGLPVAHKWFKDGILYRRRNTGAIIPDANLK